MPENKTYKICLVGNSFSNGGAEKAHAELSNSLHESGIKVYNILFENREFDYNYSGELLDLSIYKNNSILDKIKKFYTVNRFIKNHQFDYIIDFRYRGNFYSEWFLVRVLFRKSKYIPTIHSYNTDLYFTKNRSVGKEIYKKAYFIASVSKELEQSIKNDFGYSNTKTIYNSIDLQRIQSEKIKPINLNFEYIISVGRMASDNVKQHDVIIEAYSKSILPSKNIKLVFLGDGPNRANLEKLVNQKNLSNDVVFLGFDSNPYKYLNNAIYKVMASKFEGFPNVIIESFACQTPVISYDCKTGPNEIIIDKYNGLLIKDQSLDDLIIGMNQMIENQELYKYCKSNTISSSEKFSKENNLKNWLKALNIPF